MPADRGDRAEQGATIPSVACLPTVGLHEGLAVVAEQPSPRPLYTSSLCASTASSPCFLLHLELSVLPPPPPTHSAILSSKTLHKHQVLRMMGSLRPWLRTRMELIVGRKVPCLPVGLRIQASAGPPLGEDGVQDALLD